MLGFLRNTRKFLQKLLSPLKAYQTFLYTKSPMCLIFQSTVLGVHHKNINFTIYKNRPLCLFWEYYLERKVRNNVTFHDRESYITWTFLSKYCHIHKKYINKSIYSRIPDKDYFCIAHFKN